MSRRRIGQETFGFGDRRGRQRTSLDELAKLIDWSRIEAQLADISSSAKGEPAWPPLALFKALLLSVWYDLSDVKLAEALDDRASFRRFRGFSGNEATPERTAFARFRKALMVCAFDKSLFEEIASQLKARAIKVKTGTLVDATIIVSASKEDDEGHWVKHKGKPAVHGFKAHVGADADTALVEEVAITPANINDGRAGPAALPDDPGEVFADSAIGNGIFVTPSTRKAARRASSRPPCGDATSRKHWRVSMPGTNRSIGCVVGSKRSLAHGSAVMGSVACDGGASPRHPFRSA
jgi:IS5 family transposase